VISEVVQREDDRRAFQHGVVAERPVTIDSGRARVPVVEMDDVDRTVRLQPEDLQGRPTEQAKAMGVVGEVASAGWAIEPVPVERLRRVHETKPVAVGGHVKDRHVRRPIERSGVRHAQLSAGPRVARHWHRAVPRQEDVDQSIGRRRQLAEGPRERVDDVAEAAGLRPRLALGGDEGDAQRHRPMVATGRRRFRSAGPAPGGGIVQEVR